MLSFFPLDVLEKIWDLIESVSEVFLSYSVLPTLVNFICPKLGGERFKNVDYLCIQESRLRCRRVAEVFFFFWFSFFEARNSRREFEFDIVPEAPDNDKAVQFVHYIVNMYVEQSAAFTSHSWADPDIDSKRNTNGCESFHNQFGDSVYHLHPSIPNFMGKLKVVQTKTYLRI